MLFVLEVLNSGTNSCLIDRDVAIHGVPEDEFTREKGEEE